jgi:hypothetical protein
VENNTFRVHRYFFTRDSSFFLEKLPHPPPPGEFSKGSSDNNPFVLEDTLIADFERLLWVFYNEYVLYSSFPMFFNVYFRKYSIYEADVEEWSSILKLAHKWDFIEVKAFALRELEQLEIPALDKIILYHTQDIDRNLLHDAYTALTVRDEPITLQEGYQLGMETALRLAHAREIARAPAFNGRRAGTARSTVNIAGPELDTLISQLFNLSLPDASNDSTERPVTPQTPTTTGRGTPTGGRNTPQLNVRTNGSGSPAPNPARGGSVMHAYPFFSSYANLPVQGPQTGSTATQTDLPTAARANINKGARAAGAMDSKGKEAAAAAAAEASLDSVMHFDISKRDSMKRFFRMDVSLSLQQRNQEPALQRPRRPPRCKAPRRPRRMKRAKGLRGNSRQRSRAPALRARSVHAPKVNN